MDLWDCAVDWDVLTLQEIIADANDDKDVSLMKSMGRGRHTLVLGSHVAGTHRVGIVVHNRWASFVLDFEQAGRSLSLLLQVHSLRHVQVISSHLPSRMNCSDDDYEHSVRELGSLVKGSRRQSILLSSPMCTSENIRQRQD